MPPFGHILAKGDEVAGRAGLVVRRRDAVVDPDQRVVLADVALVDDEVRHSSGEQIHDQASGSGDIVGMGEAGAVEAHEFLGRIAGDAAEGVVDLEEAGIGSQQSDADGGGVEDGAQPLLAVARDGSRLFRGGAAAHVLQFTAERRAILAVRQKFPPTGATAVSVHTTWRRAGAHPKLCPEGLALPVNAHTPCLLPSAEAGAVLFIDGSAVLVDAPPA